MLVVFVGTPALVWGEKFSEHHPYTREAEFGSDSTPPPPYAVPKIVPKRGQKDPTRANESQSSLAGNYAEVLEK